MSGLSKHLSYTSKPRSAHGLKKRTAHQGQITVHKLLVDSLNNIVMYGVHLSVCKINFGYLLIEMIVLLF